MCEQAPDLVDGEGDQVRGVWCRERVWVAVFVWRACASIDMAVQRCHEVQRRT